MSKRDYYEILGIDKNANEQEIKKAYRKMAMKYHPDRNPDDKEAEQKFKEASEAYEVLGNKEKRQKYDQFGHSAFENQGQGGGFHGGGFEGFDDIFSDIFDMFGGGSSRGRRRGPKKGRDVQYNLTIDFLEAAFGAEKEITLNKHEECNTCKGSGAKPGSDVQKCSRCKGTGEIKEVHNTMLGQMVNARVCNVCGGEGKVIKEKCNTCSGSGKVRKDKKIKVKIPKGVDDESAIPLRGYGEPGERGGPSGDLYVVIRVREHKLYKRNDLDIICEMPITFTQAALGDELEVPTIHGKVKYKIQEGTQTGTVFRLKSKGIEDYRGRKGDQYVKVHVEVPKKLDSKQKDILKEFASASGEDIHQQRKSFIDKVKDAFK